jgi:hypothetical protein
MNPDQHVLLFAHPRSGSTSLYKILQLHPELNILEEPFNEGFTTWNPDHPNYLERIHDISSLDAQLAEIFTIYNGIKVLDYQLPDELNLHLLLRPDFAIIFLRRRNLLQAVVSALIAIQTNVWKKWEMTEPVEEQYRRLQPFDVEEIRQRVSWQKEHLDFVESVLDSHPNKAMIKLTYEDLYFAPRERRDEQITAIWRILGITPLDSAQIQHYLQPESMKMNSAVTYALLPNAEEIERLCGNDVTGWLFDAQH